MTGEPIPPLTTALCTGRRLSPDKMLSPPNAATEPSIHFGFHALHFFFFYFLAQTTEIYCPPILEARCLRSRLGRVAFF